MLGKAEISEDKLHLLYELLRDATKRSDLKGIYHVLFRGGRDGVGTQEGMVVHHNAEKETLEIKVKTKGRLIDKKDLLLSERSSVSKLINMRDMTPRIEADDMFFKGSQFQLAIPMPLDDRDVGFLILEAAAEKALTKEEESFLRELVEQTSGVIQNRGSAEHSRKELAALWDVGRRMVSPSDLDMPNLDDLLGKILQLALARTKTSNGVILMADEKSGDMVINAKSIIGDLMYEVPERIKRRKRGRASGIVFQVLDTNKPYLSNNIESDPNYIPIFKGIKSHISVPIPFQNRCIGVIIVESTKTNAFTLEDQKVLEELTKDIVFLVRRAQMYEATRGSAIGGKGVLIRGLSPAWEEVETRIERAAITNATVLLRGESGTGKELVAHAIHFNSKRREKKLVVVNSAAIPDQLLESALFGHVKGAFTSASYDRMGEFEKADGGTIFLDEIGELSTPLQSKLLRVLQTGEIQKIGSNLDSISVDVRVIAATSRNLEDMIEKSQFREDLYYRLNVVPIWLPALRDYKKSVAGMVKAFVQEFAIEHGLQVSGITTGAMEVLLQHDYPGNVRELKNIVEQSVIMAQGDLLSVEDLPKRLVKKVSGKQQTAGADGRDFKNTKKQVLERFEREYLSELLTEVRGNISRASEISGINRVNFYKLLRRHTIDAASYR